MPSNSPEENKSPVDLCWGVKIPTRDGIHLNATLFQPADRSDPLPVIFTLTPYISDRYTDRGMYFSRRGYIFALVDCRGRGNSEGDFDPVVKEDVDGYDCVEWFARQPWCNGQVAMWGGSYMGFNQWATLKESPPHLVTIIPMVSGYPGLDFPARFNIFTTYMMQWMTYTGGVTPNNNLFGEPDFWTQKFHEMYLNHRPLEELDQISGNLDSVFQTWIRHAGPGPYWDQVLPTAEDYRQIDVPVLSITGHFDGDQPGALEFYRLHMQHGSPEAKGNHYLIIGPWDHGGSARPRNEIGGLTFADASLLDMDALQRQWYDWTIKDAGKPEFLKKRVAYYVMGAEQWKYADTLEEIGAQKRRYYLASHRGAGDVFHSGFLLHEPSDTAADQFVYDPLDTRPGEMESGTTLAPLTDQTAALNLFGSGLVYHTEPLEVDTEVGGFVRLKLWIEMDVPDTDFGAALYEITRDGGSILLTHMILRARYRNSLREEKLVPPGKIIAYDFERFTFFSRLVEKGSRLRLVFRSINSPDYEKNYNSGGVTFADSGKDARTAHIRVYHDLDHQSCLEIPVVTE